jgi:uncharacterized membrane protein
MLKKISFKGVIIGAIVDVVGTYVWLFGVVGYLIIRNQLHTLPPREQMSELYRLYGDPAINVLNTSVAVGFSVIGGYLAARIARHHEQLNGALSSFLCVALALLTIGSFSIGWVISVVGSPILGLLGGYLRLWQTRN